MPASTRSSAKHKAQSTRVVDQVVAAIVKGTTDDASQLWAVACAEFATPDVLKNELQLSVRERVNAAARDAYSKVAADNFRSIAARFDEAAGAFLDAATICDPRTDAADVVTVSEKVRKAWQATATHSRELTELLPVLRAAAELAGFCGPDPDDVVDIAVDAKGLTRTQLMDAWPVEDRESIQARQANDGFTRSRVSITRCGRWAALIAAGAVIRAQRPALATT